MMTESFEFPQEGRDRRYRLCGHLALMPIIKDQGMAR
jgi:hypothetical protein